MEKTAKKRGKAKVPGTLRNKLMAAACMLLVASIMMVTSTYAWFTLSTAPEVTNISTTVSGNGSLEIALMPTDGLVTNIARGISSADKKTANVSWGNIVDLAEEYGLESITLQPGLLDTTSVDGLNKLLQTAVFGSDGRVEKLENNTGWAVYDAGTGENATFTKPTGDAYGVRAIAVGAQIDAPSGTKIVPYGYVVDLAFRINTDNNGAYAKLMLQHDAAQRIAGSENDETMGEGTNMTVKLGTGVSLETGKKMMDAIQITFVKDFGRSGTGITPTVIATGKLDTTGTLPTNGDGAYVVPVKLVDTDGTAIAGDVLADLPRNEAVQISAIVWMSGQDLKNESFAIDGNTFTGTLNLQFTTDVTLQPAKDADLFQLEQNAASGGEEEPGETVTPTPEPTDTPEVTNP